jgi:hypothetical protein
MPLLSTSNNVRLGKEKGELARVAQEVQGHVIHRALVKIPSNFVCIIEAQGLGFRV